MTTVIPFPAYFRNSGRQRSRSRHFAGEIIDLQARKAGDQPGKGTLERIDAANAKGGTAENSVECKKLHVPDSAAVLSLAVIVAGIVGALTLSAPRAANSEAIDRIADPFALQQLHRA